MKSRIIWSNYDHDQQSKIKIQGYISLHVTEIKNSRLHLIACNWNERSALHALHIARHFMHHFTLFHVALHVISCCISRHFMLHFTSFHVAYHTFHCTHYMHRTHVTHVVHFVFREQYAFHALHHTSHHFMCHFMSFCHENSYHTHSYHLGVKRVENRSKRHTLQLSATWVGRSIQEDKNATWVRHFYKR